MALKMRGWEMGAAVAVVVVFVVLAAPVLWRAREASNRASCQNNLKRLGIVVKMFSGEEKGRMPPLSPYPGNWMMDVPRIVPEYVNDLEVFVCPESPFAYADVFTANDGSGRPRAAECVTSLFYIYTGYTIYCDEQALALFEAFQNGTASRSNFVGVELDVPVFPGSNRIHMASQSGIPIMWDRVPLDDSDFSHRHPLGINVLHQDGHVQFVPYSIYNSSNFFPATRISAETFGSVLPDLPRPCKGL